MKALTHLPKRPWRWLIGATLLQISLVLLLLAMTAAAAHAVSTPPFSGLDPSPGRARHPDHRRLRQYRRPNDLERWPAAPM